MCVLAGTVINWEDESDPESRLHLADSFEVDADRRVSEETVMPGNAVVQARFPLQFKHRYQFEDMGQRQLPVRNAVAENEPVFEGLGSSVRSGTKQRGMPKNRLDCQIFAKP